MATYNQSQISNIISGSSLCCDVCGSDDIAQNEFGFVCKDCGIMLNMQILEYHRPYNADIIQYAPLGKTKIGTKGERLCNPQSFKLQRLNKIDSVKTSEETVMTQAAIEINRIFEALSLPISDKENVLNTFNDLRQKILKRTKYRSPEKLVPLAIYFSYKYECKPIDEQALLEISRISKEDFQAFKLQIYRHLPKYQNRNRKKYILKQVMDVTEHFGLEMYFYYQSKKILDKLWPVIKNTKDNVVTGLVTSISALCLPKQPITVSSICKRLNIRMSTIHKQVEHKIFKHLKVPGFKSLVRSADILKIVMDQLGVLLDECIERKEELPEIVEIKLGNVMQIFNSHDKFDYYFYAIKGNQNNVMIITLQLNKEAFTRMLKTDAKNEESVIKESDLLLIFGIWNGKGPPYLLS